MKLGAVLEVIDDKLAYLVEVTQIQTDQILTELTEQGKRLGRVEVSLESIKREAA